MSKKGPASIHSKEISPRLETLEDDIAPTDINKTMQYKELNTVNHIVDGKC